MTVQEQAIRMNEQAGKSLVTAARAMPEDRLTWSVLDEGRTVLDLVRECAESPLWFAKMLERRDGPPLARDELGGSETEAPATLEGCERALSENTQRLNDVIRSVPDGDMMKLIAMPWNPSDTVPAADVMFMHYWNATYHLGQINFIQTLYGDKQMR